MRGLKRYRALALAYSTAVAAIAMLAMLPGPACAGIVIGEANRSEPAIILAPPDKETVTETPAEPPPLPRVKPQRKKVSAPKPEEQKAPVKKAPAKKAPEKKATQKKAPVAKAPAKAQAAPPQQSKECDYCYSCLSMVPSCRRQWVCGKKYTERLAAGFCRR